MKKESVFPSEVKGQGFYAGQTITSPGLTKRELFAAMAMQGILSNGVSFMADAPYELAEKSLKCADELLNKLEL